MRTWNAAERILRHEAGRMTDDADNRNVPLTAIVGGRQPAAVLALNGRDPRSPGRAVSELALLAATFRPARVLVGLVVPAGTGRGLLIAHEIEVVADGWVEATRLRVWRRVGRRVRWSRSETRSSDILDTPVVAIARAIVEERPSEPEPEVQAVLLARTRAAGHLVRLGRETGEGMA